jgi:hypothetical protein
MWGKPNRIWLSLKAVYWHNKYGIEGLQDKVLLPVVIWVLH